MSPYTREVHLKLRKALYIDRSSGARRIAKESDLDKSDLLRFAREGTAPDLIVVRLHAYFHARQEADRRDRDSLESGLADSESIGSRKRYDRVVALWLYLKEKGIEVEHPKYWRRRTANERWIAEQKLDHRCKHVWLATECPRPIPLNLYLDDNLSFVQWQNRSKQALAAIKKKDTNPRPRHLGFIPRSSSP